MLGKYSLQSAIAVLVVLTACAHTAVVPDAKPDTDTQILLHDIVQRLNGQNSAIERFREETTKSTDELRRQISEEAVLQKALASELTDLLIQLKSSAGSERAYVDIALRQLDSRLSEQQRQLEMLRAEIDGNRIRDAGTLSRWESSLKDFGDAVRQVLHSIDANLARQKTFWEQAGPSLLGTFLGALIGLFSSWYFARWNNARARDQKRMDLTVDIINQYGSDTMQKRFEETLGFLSPQGQAGLNNARNRNEVVRMLGFFKYVEALSNRNALNKELLQLSQIELYAKDFFEMIEGVDSGVYPDFDGVKKQLREHPRAEA